MVKTSVFDSKTTSDTADCVYVELAGACRDGTGNFHKFLEQTSVTEAQCQAKCDALGTLDCHAWDYDATGSTWCGIWSETLYLSDGGSGWTFTDPVGQTLGSGASGVCKGDGGTNKCHLRTEIEPCPT